MNKQVSRFARRLVIVTAVIAVAGAVVFGLFLQSWYIQVLPALLIFSFLLTLFSYSYLVKVADKDFLKFTRANMIVTIVRLLTYSAVTVLYFVISNEKSFVFLLAIALFYLVYTSLEVTDLSVYLRRAGKKPE